jgi:hypothetical protein
MNRQTKKKKRMERERERERGEREKRMEDLYKLRQKTYLSC